MITLPSEHRMFVVKRCKRCGLEISPKDLVMKAGQDLVYHIDCFTCSCCHIPLTREEYFGVNGDYVYCKTHFTMDEVRRLDHPLDQPMKEHSNDICRDMMNHPQHHHFLLKDNMMSPGRGIPSPTLNDTHKQPKVRKPRANKKISPQLNQPHPNQPPKKKGRPRKIKLSMTEDTVKETADFKSSFDQLMEPDQESPDKEDSHQRSSCSLHVVTQEDDNPHNGVSNTETHHLYNSFFEASSSSSCLSSSSSSHSPSKTGNISSNPDGTSTSNQVSHHHHHQRTKRMRTSFKHHQLKKMKAYFSINHNPDSKDLKGLSLETGLPKRVLQVS